jgi:hypothetical protein
VNKGCQCSISIFVAIHKDIVPNFDISWIVCVVIILWPIVISFVIIDFATRPTWSDCARWSPKIVTFFAFDHWNACDSIIRNT